MSYLVLAASALLLISCASRNPASSESQTWKQVEERSARPELMNRSR